jgi:glycosyltransferase involved in cell wall biosynthesis
VTTESIWLTIVTVVKDDQAGLERSARSLSVQNRAGVEYLVIDSSADASSSAGVLEESGISSSSIQWCEPRGIYSAMNFGLELARGKYVYFLNAGETFRDSTVLEDLNRIVLLKAPAWIVGRVQILEQSGDCVTSAPWDYKAEKKALFARGLFPPHQGTIVRTATLRSVGGFNQQFTIAADYAAALSLSRVDDPFMTNQVIATFFEGGISTTRWQDSFREFHQARVEVFAPRGLAALCERIRYWRHFSSVWLVRKMRKIS